MLNFNVRLGVDTYCTPSCSERLHIIARAVVFVTIPVVTNSSNYGIMSAKSL